MECASESRDKRLEQYGVNGRSVTLTRSSQDTAAPWWAISMKKRITSSRQCIESDKVEEKRTDDMRKSLEELQQAVKMDDIYHFKLRDSKTTEEKPKKERNVPPAPVNMKMISLKERGLCLELCKRTLCHQAQLFECQLQRGRSDIEYFFHC